ncbi:hypothetical protein [Pseudarthrobacter sp. ATCC 49987]|uniref:hypothetical protein n=1 Tax=Pseudarthrobacter sp. ATCC 49987 TaxID=2698204 RepID=UPI00136ED89C|nr:hypothetical protein [Pseudarthrobacter sp. ATCC 49987]
MATKPDNNELRSQDFTRNTVDRSTLILSIILTIFATAVIVTIANWFLYTNIHSAARQAVHADIQLVSKEQARQQ